LTKPKKIKPILAPDPRNKETIRQRAVRMEALMVQYQKLYQEEQSKNFRGNFTNELARREALAYQNGQKEVAQWITRAEQRQQTIEGLELKCARLIDHVASLESHCEAKDATIKKLTRKPRRVTVHRECTAPAIKRRPAMQVYLL